MQTISIENKWIETARLFGDISGIVKEALRSYFIRQCEQKINNADAQMEFYKHKYNCDYSEFKKLIQTDESFLNKIESQNLIWEQDAIEWEYWTEERETWSSQLTAILNL